MCDDIPYVLLYDKMSFSLLDELEELWIIRITEGRKEKNLQGFQYCRYSQSCFL